MKRFVPLMIITVLALTALSAAAQMRVMTPMPRATVRSQRPPTARPNWWGAAPPQTPGNPQPNQGPRARGIVAAIASNSITIKTQCGFNTYFVTPSTEIFIKGKPGALADIAQGNVAAISFDFDMASFTTPAKRIEVTLRQPAGRITSIDGSVLKITDEFGTTWTVTVSPDTRIMCLRQPLALTDVLAGYSARAEGQVQGNNVQAKALQIQPSWAKGVVVAVNANTITLKTVNQQTVQGTLSDRTRVLIRPRVGPNQDGTRADIKKDMAANIGGLAHEGQPMDVLSVELLIGQ